MDEETAGNASFPTKPLSTSNHDIMMLWMLLDGIGLAIIASCTVMEGFELWKDFFAEYVQYNVPATVFWLCGRFSQVCGLLLLIAHAASHAIGIMVHELEQCGMLLLSTGPILNLIACSIFDSQADPTFVFNKQWISSECLELFGILLLDLSMMDSTDELVLFEEVIGFFILGCASLIDFDYSPVSHGDGMNRKDRGMFSFLRGMFSGRNFPMITLRLDMIHVADCVGLLMLTIVAGAQYQMKQKAKLKVKLLLQQQQSHTQPAGIIKHHRQSIKTPGTKDPIKSMHGGEMNGNATSSNNGSSSNGMYSNVHGHNNATHTDQMVSRSSPRQQARKNMGSKRDGFHGNHTEDRDREHLLVHPNRLHGHTD